MNAVVPAITETNWNSKWESEFQPVLIADFACVRADFHPPVTGVAFDIVITPKMSFGTGHHATTRGCLIAADQWLKHHRPRRILDMGSGTGVLAIATAKASRARALAVDIDAEAVDVVQVDVCRIGGVTPWLEVAALANAAGLRVCPHAGDLTQVHQHLVKAIPNHWLLEVIPIWETSPFGRCFASTWSRIMRRSVSRMARRFT